MNLTFQRTKKKENTMTDIMTEERSHFDTPPYTANNTANNTKIMYRKKIQLRN